MPLDAQLQMFWMSSFDGSTYSLFKCTPPTQSRVQEVPAHMQSLGPFAEAQCMSLMCEIAICSFISMLLALGRPSAVRWFIIAIIINPVERHSIWFCTHILNERSERIVPTITDDDSSLLIMLSHRAVWVATSLFHGLPYIVCRRAESSMFKSRAAAACRIAIVERVRFYAHNLAAITFTRPKRPSWLLGISSDCNYRKLSEPLARKIFESRMISCSVTSSHAIHSLLVKVWLFIVGCFQRPTICINYNLYSPKKVGFSTALRRLYAT